MGMWKRRALNKISILSLYFADLHLNGTIYWYICDQASETLQAMSENNVYILSKVSLPDQLQAPKIRNGSSPRSNPFRCFTGRAVEDVKVELGIFRLVLDIVGFISM